MDRERLRSCLSRGLYLFPLILILACGGGSTSSIPPPENFEFVYVANQNSNTISGFQIDSSGHLTELQGSPFKVPFPPPYALMSDARSRFLLVRGNNVLVPAAISASHALVFNSTVHLAPGFTLLDPLGRFVFSTDNNFTFDTPIHVYSATADLSFPEVGGSPFLSGVLPAAIDPSGKFIFGFGPGVDTLQIGATGALTETSNIFSYSPIYGFMHPSGQFLYVQHLSNSSDALTLDIYRVSSSGVLSLANSEADFGAWLVAFHPSGGFVFSLSGNTINTLPIDVSTGTIAPGSAYSVSGNWSGPPALNPSGSRLFAISKGANCTVSGLLSVFSVNSRGRLQGTGTTAPTGPCPDAAVVLP
jgi:hypothetical protein